MKRASRSRSRAIAGLKMFWSLAAIAVVLGAGQGRVLATEHNPSPRIARRLEIVVVGPQASRDELAVAVASLMAGDDRIVVMQNDARLDAAAGRDTSSPAPGPPGIRIELGEAGRVRIVALAAARPPAIREIDVANPAPVAAEVVAQIVQQTAHALLALEEVAPRVTLGEQRAPQEEKRIPREEKLVPQIQTIDPEDVSLKPKPSNRHDPVKLVMTIAYVTRSVLNHDSATGIDVSSNGVGASLTLILPDQQISPYVALMLDQILSTTNDSGFYPTNPTLHFSTTSLRAMIGLACQLGRKFEIAVGAGGGIDRMSPGDPVWVKSTNWAVGARGLMKVSYLVTTWGLEVLGAVTVDVNTQVDFQGFNISGTKRTQPGMMIGLGWRE